jgi:hypothetical protein
MACAAYIHDKKDGPETSPTACTWPVQPIYAKKKICSRDFPYLLVACPAYIRDEKIWSRDFPNSVYMACIAYVRDEKI